jgi:hypothetical protein
MRIYKIWPAEGFEWLQPVNPEDYDRLTFDTTPRVQGWTPIRMKRLTVTDEGRPRTPGDFPSSGGTGSLILSRNAKESLEGLLASSGELLPLEVPGGSYWVLNVTSTLNVLDEERSKLVRASETGRILMVPRPVFRTELDISDPPLIFKLPQLLRGGTYATQGLAEALDKHKLTGLRLDLVHAPN